MPYKTSFRVITVTSEDENFPANELNHHSPATKGWTSARFCSYPQRVILALDRRVRLCKIQILCHQYLIASKVEFFVGDTADDTKPDVENARYVRLGYVSLSDNESTKFKARELKSVHVDAVGTCVQLVLHKNHANRFNLYSQVGLVAVNVIGDPVVEGDQEKLVTGEFQRPDFIPPTEDLAFDIYQDPEVANIIRKLEKQKLDFVADERFDEALKLRNAIGQLQHIGERLGRLSLEKQQAVDEENYERAKLKKYQIDEIRANLYRDPNLAVVLADRTNNTGPEKPDRSNISTSPSVNGNVMPRTSESEGFFVVATPPYDKRPRSNDDRPLPTLKHRNNNAVAGVSPSRTRLSSVNQAEIHVGSPGPADLDSVDEVSDLQALDEFGMPADGSFDAFADDPVQSEVPTKPEPLSETNRRMASVAIDVVGLDLVTKLFSKSWIFRQQALEELEKRTQSNDDEALAIQDPLAELRSSAFVVQRALHDQVLSVFRLATRLIKGSIVDFSDRHNIPRPEVYHALEKIIPVLFNRIGDHSARIRDVAKSQITMMAQWPQLRQCSALWHELLRPFSAVTLDRLALNRMEMVTELYASIGIDDQGGFTLDAVSTFTAKALNHRSNEVRDSAENLMVALYRAEDRSVIRRVLPPSNVNTLRHPLFRRLFAKFDRIDEKYAPVDATSPPDPIKNQRELNALQADVQNLRTMANQERRKSTVSTRQPMANRSKHSDTTPSRQRTKSHKSPVPAARRMSNQSKNRQRTTPASPPSQSQQPSLTQSLGEPDLLLNLDKTCIFCGEHREEFTEDGLDLHYWKDCPMLQQCVYCKQVVEVAGLSEHLFNECESPVHHVRCDRCCEAVPQSDLLTHSCVPIPTNAIRCPLCHLDLSLMDPRSGVPSAPEDVWKAHLMSSGPSGTPTCTNNPRQPAPRHQAPHVGSQQAGDRSGDSSKMKTQSNQAAAKRTLIPRPTQPSHVRLK